MNGYLSTPSRTRSDSRFVVVFLAACGLLFVGPMSIPLVAQDLEVTRTLGTSISSTTHERTHLDHLVTRPLDEEAPSVVVLGIAQDAGAPQIGCLKDCCRDRWNDTANREHVSSIAILDPVSEQRWVIDCTPDFPDQLRTLYELTASWDDTVLLDGVLVTHAHMGHYTGLMHLGREAFGATGIPVYAMPRMAAFLESNGPWSQLVQLENIVVERISAGGELQLNDRISIVPMLVPHRDEYSETVGFEIRGPDSSLLFIPDIDKWERWDVRIESLIERVDYALLDGTFYADGEIPGRDISEIPHPFIEESIERFADLPASDRNKVFFIHLNHTNPALNADSDANQAIEEAGMNVARPLMKFPL